MSASNPPNQITNNAAAIPVRVVSGSGGSGVSQIIAGGGIDISPVGGTGAVTITATGLPGLNSVNATLASGNNENLSPTDYAAGVTNRIEVTTSSAGWALGGIVAAGTDNFTMDFWNGTANAGVLNNGDSGSSAGNQFLLPGNIVSSTVAVGAYSGVTLKWQANPLGTGTGYWTVR
jgi:hypothetical protein